MTAATLSATSRRPASGVTSITTKTISTAARLVGQVARKVPTKRGRDGPACRFLLVALTARSIDYAIEAVSFLLFRRPQIAKGMGPSSR